MRWYVPDPDRSVGAPHEDAIEFGGGRDDDGHSPGVTLVPRREVAPDVVRVHDVRVRHGDDSLPECVWHGVESYLVSQKRLHDGHGPARHVVADRPGRVVLA